MGDLKKPGFLQSLLCFGGIIAIVIPGLIVFGINLHVLLIAGLIWTAAHALLLGFDFRQIKSAMSEGIEKGLNAIYIFVLIGVLIAALIEGGTVASLIYYGLELLRPGFFLPAGLLLCSLMSLATGTAWGTIGNDWRCIDGARRCNGHTTADSCRHGSCRRELRRQDVAGI